MEPLAQRIKKLSWVSAVWLKTIKIIIKIGNKLTFMVLELDVIRPLSHEWCYRYDIRMFGSDWCLFCSLGRVYFSRFMVSNIY